MSANVAGQHVRGVAERYRWGSILAILAMAFVGFAVAYATDFDLVAVLVAEALVIVTCLVVDRFVFPVFDRYNRGAIGEEGVGELLASLEDRGWLSLYDIETGRGNIDAVLIGPGGVFTLEVKAHRGAISSDSIDPKMLKQAYAEAKWIERVGSLEVTPLLVFSAAYLHGRAVSKQRGVTVLPARMLAGHLDRCPRRLSVSEAATLHGRLVLALGHY